MNRAILVSAMAVALGAAGTATAGGEYCDDFDTYRPGPLAGQECEFGTSCQDPGCPEGCRWEPWQADPRGENVLVVIDPAESPPHAIEVEGTDDLLHTYKCLDLSGVIQYSVDVFIPGDYVGDTYFILLNTFDRGGESNWSTQLHFDSNGDQIKSDFDDGLQQEVPFVRGAWKTLRVVIDLDAPPESELGQVILYDDRLIIAKSWTEGVSGGGAPRLDAVDVFANGATPVYYDNFRIRELTLLGACCFADEEGSCAELPSNTCGEAGGVFQGFGSTCSGQCPRLGPDGWELEAPFFWGDQQGRNDTCAVEATCEDVYGGPDIQFAVEIPWASNWRFWAGSDDFDAEVLIGTTGRCSHDLVDARGCVEGSGVPCVGSQDEGGDSARFVLGLEEGDVVNVDVEAVDSKCGEMRLIVEAPCPDISLPEGDPEGETCGLRENDGCNMDEGEEAFRPIALGQVIVGTSWLSSGGYDRDTDWYEIELDPGNYVMTTYGEFGGTGVAGVIQYLAGREGSGDCDDITGFISPFGVFDRCAHYPAERPREVEFEITVAGTYWLFVGPAFGGAEFDCDEDPGADYFVVVGVGCTPAPDGDVNFDGCTDFDDVLLVLSQWRTEGGREGDADCDNVIGYDDLVLVIAGFDEDC